VIWDVGFEMWDEKSLVDGISHLTASFLNFKGFDNHIVPRKINRPKVDWQKGAEK
jgi:hypothetical protein